MKTFVALFVLLSIIAGLNANCIKRRPDDICEERIFPEPEPKEIHYIYHGESCDCPKYHDVVAEKPIPCEKKEKPATYEYAVHVPVDKKEEKIVRYMFDVHVEAPVTPAPEQTCAMAYNYKLQVPTKPKEERLTRYMFDAHVEQPEKPCEEKPWQGLVAQVDRMLLPVTGECKNPAHTPESCNCGCREKSHTPKTCNCGRDTYKVPIKYNSRYALQSDVSQIKSSKRVKRDVSVENKLKAKLREIKFPSLKPLTKTPAKDLNPTEVEGPLKLKLNLKRSKTATIDDNLRLKRKNESPCAYTYESCDPKKHNKNGCPLCYRCNCEPVTQQRPDQRFSPYDIKIPYKFVTHAEAPGKAPMNQEFDYEPPSYTGLKEQDMYKNYIQQVISKYPEHMARKMPDIQQQQQDLMKFIAELARSDKSPAGKVENEDVRYKIVDNAMDMYKHYEQAISALPKPQFGSNGKLFHKRGAALELVELDPETFNSGSFKIYDNVGSTS